MGMLIKSVMLFRIAAMDLEGDGSINYLLEQDGNNSGQHLVAFSHADVGLKLGDERNIYVEAECNPVWALDPVPKVFEEAFPWGMKRQIYICNATSITVNGQKYTNRR
jgi:hypothetical protein